MQSDRDLLKQALHTLEGWANHREWVWPESALEQAKRNTTEAITALRERLAQPEFDATLQSAAMTQTAAKLAQPEQEPVAHLWQHSETGRTRIVLPDQIVTADATWHVVGPLYLTPPRREWRGLSDDDLEDLLGFHCDIYGEMNEVDAKKFAADIEKRLKEKNA